MSGESRTTDRQFVQAGHGQHPVAQASSLWTAPAPYIDDQVAMLTNAGGGSWTTRYYHADAQFNTLALTGGSATVIERAQYEPYGTTSLTDSGGSPIGTSAIGNVLLRQGIPRDWETGNDDNRHWWYVPKLGRWGNREIASSDVSNPYFALMKAPLQLIARSEALRVLAAVTGAHSSDSIADESLARDMVRHIAIHDFSASFLKPTENTGASQSSSNGGGTCNLPSIDLFPYRRCIKTSTCANGASGSFYWTCSKCQGDRRVECDGTALAFDCDTETWSGTPDCKVQPNVACDELQFVACYSDSMLKQ